MSAQISKKTRIPNRADRTFVKNGYSRTGSTLLKIDANRELDVDPAVGLEPTTC